MKIRGLAPRCCINTSRKCSISFQGYDCSSFKVLRDMSLNRLRQVGFYLLVVCFPRLTTSEQALRANVNMSQRLTHYRS